MIKKIYFVFSLFIFLFFSGCSSFLNNMIHNNGNENNSGGDYFEESPDAINNFNVYTINSEYIYVSISDETLDYSKLKLVKYDSSYYFLEEIQLDQQNSIIKTITSESSTYYWKLVYEDIYYSLNYIQTKSIVDNINVSYDSYYDETTFSWESSELLKLSTRLMLSKNSSSTNSGDSFYCLDISDSDSFDSSFGDKVSLKPSCTSVTIDGVVSNTYYLWCEFNGTYYNLGVVNSTEDYNFVADFDIYRINSDYLYVSVNDANLDYSKLKLVKYDSSYYFLEEIQLDQQNSIIKTITSESSTYYWKLVYEDKYESSSYNISNNIVSYLYQYPDSYSYDYHTYFYWDSTNISKIAKRVIISKNSTSSLSNSSLTNCLNISDSEYFDDSYDDYVSLYPSCGYVDVEGYSDNTYYLWIQYDKTFYNCGKFQIDYYY